MVAMLPMVIVEAVTPGPDPGAPGAHTLPPGAASGLLFSTTMAGPEPPPLWLPELDPPVLAPELPPDLPATPLPTCPLVFEPPLEWLRLVVTPGVLVLPLLPT